MSTLAAPVPPTRPTVICVDDEPQVLLGLGLHLRRHYDFVSFTTPAEALARIAVAPPAVVVSDMRMPVMNGSQFLTKVRASSPDTVRILLTGHAELESAISAVNDGQIFRFLTKPCPPATLLSTVQAAAEQFRLVTSEKVLLEQTVRGSISVLVDVLSMVSPAAFGRGRRIKPLVQAMAAAMSLPDAWALELAAELFHLGYVSLSPETVEKLHKHAVLTDRERALVAKVPAVTHQLLQHIPRLEPVWAILRQLSEEPAKRQLPAKCLAAASAFDDLCASGKTADEAVRDLMRGNAHDEPVLKALTQAQSVSHDGLTVSILPLAKLAPGQLLASDVFATSGALLLAKGTQITPPVLDRLRNIAEGVGVQEPIRVWERGAPV